MRRIALGVTMLATMASGCLSASRRLEPPVVPEHNLANPAGGSTSTTSTTAQVAAADGGSAASDDGSTGPRLGFRNKKAVSDSVMFGNQPESSYRDTPVP